ncbi:hypothetical protein SmJEL517_g01818 [Synchytrium microbalum]|uniref:Glycoside hydrolase family 5 domain-containing protein n=1 Tax=Synchytrium microbalum TaxID=1806994 RepID=A0A507C8D6_9FUNG|nr:uncharacterized protein SmJEL517_g01818 [Synchytrium microbalum]TPX35882.1 hypothetical protein SmJEL517_g01818 [Synchytrium microbalum]
MASSPDTQPQPQPSVQHQTPAYAAHDWSNVEIRTDTSTFRDQFGRNLLLRGVNLECKTPSSISQDGKPSYVGRPIPVNEADQHFSRLRTWGFTILRWSVAWEALEHAGPGVYDEEYILYLIDMIRKANEYGMKVFIDPHQDCFSRFSGGSGAPEWTFRAAQLNVENFNEVGAALIHKKGEHVNRGLWSTNYTKLASCTMWTLFFAGDIFAPTLKYNNQPIQSFLQSHFIKCFQNLARRLVLAGVTNVIGYEVMNEPHMGYIGMQDIRKQFDSRVNLIVGACPVPLKAFALADGHSQLVDIYVRSWPVPGRKSHKRAMNEAEKSAWLTPFGCIWKQHGVWEWNEKLKCPVALNPHYFSQHPKTGAKINFDKDLYHPFLNSYMTAIREVHPGAIIFVEPIPLHHPPTIEQSERKDIVYAPHWYDLNVMFYKSFKYITVDVQGLSSGKRNIFQSIYLGMEGAFKNYSRQLKNVVEGGKPYVGNIPVLIGETGLPQDINGGEAFRSGEYKHQINALDCILRGLDSNLVSYTLWNYHATNNHSDGDDWNGENFSIFTLEPHASSIPIFPTPSDKVGHPSHAEHKGGRALDAVIRPYASRIPGTPIMMSFNRHSKGFYLEIKPGVVEGASVTDIFIPSFQFYDGIRVEVSSGTWEYREDLQTLYWKTVGATETCWIKVEPVKGVKRSKLFQKCR